MAQRKTHSFTTNCIIFLMTFGITTLILTKVSVILGLVVAAKVVSHYR